MSDNNRLVWVDDDHDLISPQSNALQDCGYIVDVVPDVDKAIAVIKKNCMQLRGIILDVMMNPGVTFRKENHVGGLLTGLILFKYLRTESLCPPLKAFVFSHRFDPDAKDQLSKFGVNYYQKQYYKGKSICDLVKAEFGSPGEAV